MKHICPFYSRQKMIAHLLVFMLSASFSILAEQKFTQSTDDLQKIITDSAQNILGSCQSWPPKLAKSPQDQTEAPNSKRLQDATAIITTQLTRNVFGVDPMAIPFQYDASFLRLLDSVDTSDPAVSDDKLFGLAQLTDPNQLNLWGTSLVVVKYDCLSMLSLMAQSNASFSIPFFSLNAAFRANSGLSANQTSVFMIGLFQSPFDFLYNAQDQPQQRVFAGFKAIDWRLRTNNRGSAQYVSAAHFLSITKSTANSQTLSIMGNFKGGVQIPFFQLGGSTAGQLSNSLQSDAKSYITYFWGFTQQSLPDLSTLTAHIADSLPSLVPDTETIKSETDLAVRQSVVGWPVVLCINNTWTAIAKNSHFIVRSLEMTPATPVNGLPSCNITLHLSLADTAENVTDPLIALVYTQGGATDSQITVPFRLSKMLRFSGKTEKHQETAISSKGSYTWQVSSPEVRWKGRMEVDEKGRITAMYLKTIEFCPDGIKALDLVNWFDSKVAKIQLDGAGHATVDIPLKWNRYDGNCKKIRVDPERLRGQLTQTFAYEGCPLYESPGKSECGGMVLIKELPGSQ